MAIISCSVNRAVITCYTQSIILTVYISDTVGVFLGHSIKGDFKGGFQFPAFSVLFNWPDKSN